MNTLTFQGNPRNRLQYRPAPYRPALGQAPAVNDALSPEMEKAYQTMTVRDKYLALAGYQWLAAMTSQGLKYGDGPYIPFLPVSVDSVFGFLDSTKNILSALTAPLVELLVQFGVEMTAAPEAQKSATTVLSDLRNVRNRVVKDLVAEGNVVELEYFGDLPGFPGEVVYRKVAQYKDDLTRPADLSALFAGKDPATLLKDGLMLKEKYEEIGVPPKDIKYSMDAAPVIIIIVAIFAAILLVLGILFLVRHFGFQKEVFDKTISEAERAFNSGRMSSAEFADVLKNAQNATAVWSHMFKWLEMIPWTTVALIAGGAAALIWGVPAIIQAFRSKPEPSTT